MHKSSATSLVFFLGKTNIYCSHKGGQGWQWGGCSDNVQFGEKISKQYVDTQETGQDSRAAVNLHNNAAGRLVRPVNTTNYSLRGNPGKAEAVTERQCFPITGCKSDYEARVQVSRHVGELQHSNLLDAVVRFQRDWELPESQTSRSPETRPGQEAQQRRQPGRHCRRASRHRPNRAHLPGRVSGLLQAEHQPGSIRHRRPGVRAASGRNGPAGETQLPAVVSRLRPEGGGAAHRGCKQLQLQVSLVLHGEVRALLASGGHTRVRQEGRYRGTSLQKEAPDTKVKQIRKYWKILETNRLPALSVSLPLPHPPSIYNVITTLIKNEFKRTSRACFTQSLFLKGKHVI